MSHRTTFGLKPAQQFTTPDTLRQLWSIADDGGLDGCWVFDHFAAMGPDRTGDVYEAWTLLAAMAEATSRVRVGSIVTGNGYRHPAVLAKMAVTVDHLSDGRLDMGLGAGGDLPVDAALGMPCGPIGERLDRLDEACRALKLLWTEPTATLPGTHYRLDGALANPKPLQQPHPPLWMGSSGERRGLRIVAEHADAWLPAALPGTDPAELRRLSGVLDAHCEAIGRDPSEIRRAAQLLLPEDPDEALRTVEAHVAAGFTDIVLMLFDGSPAAIAKAAMAADLLPRLRALG